MKKQLLIFAALIALACPGAQAVMAQLPGGLPRIPRPGRPKPTPTPVPAPTETAPTAPAPAETQPSSARPQPAAANPAPAQPQAVAGSGALAVLKNLVAFNTRTVTSYKGDGSTYSWTPQVTFDTNGNIPSGAQYYVTVSMPGGAPWVEMDCKWDSDHYQCGGPNVPEDKGTTATGLFPFAIKMRNELQGTDQTLFNGKVKIEKAANENGTPAERAKKSFFYPNMDWALPVGYVFYGPEDNYLYTAFWVRGATYKVQPHVYYKGQRLDYGGGDKSSCNDRAEVGDAYIRTVKPAPIWRLVECRLYTVIVRDKGNKDDTRHILMSHPGDYEIRVLWNDELSRSIKFNISPDGNFAGGVPLLYRIDPREEQRMPGVIVPVAILDAQDGAWNKAAWKTDAYYGNPPAGFNWP
ncbi:MAG TPA: hypothetical protein VF656_19865 [Pyrinomonadaceae bacterium]|jgi:hypothetical protein